MSVQLSLCMIVRDEIDGLEACLDSLAPWVDEIAVLDTGSVDGTWELVQVRAHRSAQIVWPDHFAEARNQALDLVSGDWVLVVDADERLVSGGDELRAAIQDPTLLAAEICLHNDMGDGTHGEFWAVRLFRRHPDLRYTGRIHEQVAGSVRELMTREPRWRTGRVSLVLHHDGYVPAKFHAKGKAERNVRLLERALSDLDVDAPVHQRVYLEYKLSAALGAGPTGQVWLLRAARRLLDEGEAMVTQVPLGPEILVSAAQVWVRGGEGSAALEAADLAAVGAPDHPMVALVRGQALLATGDLEGAEDAMSAAGRAAGTAAGQGFYFDRDAHTVVLAIGRAELAHRRGQHGDAVQILEQACASVPGSSQAALARLYAMVHAGQAEEALREGVAYMKAYPDDRNGLLACAGAAEALGMDERAQRWRAKALG